MGPEPKGSSRAEVTGASNPRGTLVPLALALLVAGVAPGCAPSGYYKVTQDQMDSLLTTQAALMKRVERLDRKLDETRGGVSSSRASTESKMTELNQRLDVVVGKLEESMERMSQFGIKVDAVRQRITTSDSAGPVRIIPRDASGIPDPEAAYQAAYSDYAAGRYTLARDAFRSYLQHYPDTEVADNAQYWIGETLYATGDFAGAITEFKLVAERYPKGDKVPAALLKIGIAYSRLKNSEEAKKYFRQVTQKYPKSSEASLAKERLAQLP